MPLFHNPQQFLHKEARSNGTLQDFYDAPTNRDGLTFSDGSTPQAYLGRTDHLVFLEDGTP